MILKILKIKEIPALATTSLSNHTGITTMPAYSGFLLIR